MKVKSINIQYDIRINDPKVKLECHFFKNDEDNYIINFVKYEKGKTEIESFEQSTYNPKTHEFEYFTIEGTNLSKKGYSDFKKYMKSVFKDMIEKTNKHNFSYGCLQFRVSVDIPDTNIEIECYPRYDDSISGKAWFSLKMPKNKLGTLLGIMPELGSMPSHRSSGMGFLYSFKLGWNKHFNGVLMNGNHFSRSNYRLIMSSASEKETDKNLTNFDNFLKKYLPIINDLVEKKDLHKGIEIT